MAMYLVQVNPTRSGATIYDSASVAIVNAADGPGAIALVKARYPQSDLQNATATAMPSTLPLDDWKIKIRVVGVSVDVQAQAVGTSSDNTIDKIAALLVTALNATTEISTSSYNASTNVLTVAGSGDNLGASKLYVTITDATGFARQDLVGTIVDKGVAASALTVAFPADSTPGVWKMFDNI